MNRSRRGGHQKPFIVGGVYNISSCPHAQQNNQLSNVNKTQQQQSAKIKPTIQQIPQNEKQPIKPLQQSPKQPQLSEQKSEQQQEFLPPSIAVDTNVVITNNIQNADSTDTTTTSTEKEIGTRRINDATSEENVDRKTFFKKIFAIRKKSSIRAKEKKIRQNRNLRKVILPKNALMALNEVKGVQIGDFVINSIPSGGFSALVTVNQNQYEGRGISKAMAKNNACEKALRDFVISKMQQKPRRMNTQSSSEIEQMDATDSIDGDGNQTNDSDGNCVGATDDADVPMVNLASFALFKLFSEWESDGFYIPEFHNGSTSVPAGEKGSIAVEKLPKKATIKTELPPNWETLHPATLLCMMRPGLTYSNWGCEGERPNIIQSLSVTVDDEEFIGCGRSKKIARKNAAIAACNKLFGTNFIKEEQ